MKKPTKRSYQSPARQQQADDTRRRIVDAARTCFLAQGYAETTIEAIAVEASVAVPTVYAAFGSKKGVLAEILHQARFGPEYQAILREAQATTNPADRLRLTAKIVRQIYAGEHREITLLRGAAMVAPELAKAGESRESGRLKSQQINVDALVASDSLRADLTPEQAVDVLWAFTSREFYYMLVVERGWTPEAFEPWLADVLITSLLKPGTY